MGIFDRFKTWGSDRREKATGAAQRMVVGYNGASFTSWKYEELIRVGYLRNVVIYRCVELGSQLFSQVPWYAVNSQDKEVPDNNPLVQLMNRPNPWQSGVQFRHQMRAQLRLHGNCYVQKIRGTTRIGTNNEIQTNVPRELYALPPERMIIEIGSDGKRKDYKYQSPDGSFEIFPIDPITGESDILHVKRFNPLDQLYGMGDLIPASRSTDTWNAVVEYNKCLLDNSGNPPGLFSYEQNDKSIITPKQQEQLQTSIEDRYTGVKNAGKPITAVNVKYTPLAWSPKDMEWNTSKESVAKDICIAFGVPYVLLNMTDATFSNAEEARLSYFEDQILPELELFRDEFNNWFAKDFKNLELKFNTDELPFMSQKLAKKANAIENMSLILTINEARELFGFEKIEGYDYIKGAQAAEGDSHSDPSVVPPPAPGNELTGLPDAFAPASGTTPAKPSDKPADKPAT